MPDNPGKYEFTPEHRQEMQLATRNYQGPDGLPMFLEDFFGIKLKYFQREWLETLNCECYSPITGIDLASASPKTMILMPVREGWIRILEHEGKPVLPGQTELTKEQLNILARYSCVLTNVEIEPEGGDAME